MKRPNHRLLFTLFLFLFTCGATSAFAQITPSQDSYTDTAKATTNFGGATTVGVSSTGTGIQTAYIQFDLSSIPSGYTSSNIAKVTLKLYVNSVPAAGSFNVYLVNGSWAEKKITADLAPALGGTIASNVSLASANAHDWVTIDVTTALGEWLDGSQANDGLALVANSGLAATIDSKENTSQSHPAEIDIVYASGGGGTITGVQTPSGSGLTGGGNSGTLSLGLQTNCSNNQVLQWNGSAWVCASAGTGTITGVTAGTALTGGGTGGTVTLNLDTTKVPLLKVANSFTANQTFNGYGNSAMIGDMGCGSGYVGMSLFFGSGTNCTQYALLGDAPGNLYINRPGGGSMYFRENNGTELTIASGGNITAAGNVAAATFTGDGSKLSNIGTLGGNNTFNGFNWFAKNTTFSGNGEYAVLGDMGCASKSGGITFQGVNCYNYALLDYNGQTILNRTGGQNMSFREANGSDQMTLFAGGGARIRANTGTDFGWGQWPTALWVENDSSSANQNTLVLWDPNIYPQGSGLCWFDVTANFFCAGSKSAVVPVDGGSRQVALYAVEAPENWFEDYGGGTLVNGSATVTLDATFAQTVNTGESYRVFVTPNGDCKGLYVTHKTPTSFEVHELGGGRANIEFDYRIIAKRRGFETVRMADKTATIKAIKQHAEDRDAAANGRLANK